MAYKKLNLKNGTVVTADHFAHLEDGIEEAGKSGLPETADPLKQLVTDADGKVAWEDRLAYKYTTTQKGYITVVQDAELVDMEGQYGLATPLASSPVAGETYTVIIGSNEYTSKCVDFSALTEGVEAYVFGNTAIMGDEMPIENPVPDATYLLMLMPGGSDGYYGLVASADSVDSPILTIRSAEEIETKVVNIKKVDKELLDVDTPNWNAAADEAGYVENRTHYTADVGTLVYDATNLSGLDMFTFALGGDVCYKISEHVFSLDDLSGFTYYTADSATGAKTQEKIASTENLISVYGVASATLGNMSIFVVADKDKYESVMAAAGVPCKIPSNGTYISTAKGYAEIVVGEYTKRLDSKYVNLANYYTKNETENKITAATRVVQYSPTGIGSSGVSYTMLPTTALTNKITAGSGGGNDAMIFNIIIPNSATVADTLNITVHNTDKEVVAVFAIDDAIVPGEERYVQVRCSMDKTNFPIVVATGASPDGVTAAALYSSVVQTHSSTEFQSITIETGSGDANIPIGTNVKMWL